MPTYVYLCENRKCKIEFEIQKSITDDSVVLCPKCGKTTNSQRFFAPTLVIKGEPTTVGHLAARNTEKMGTYEYQEKTSKRKQRIRQATDKFLEETKGKNIQHDGTLPWYRSGKIPGLERRERPIKGEEVEKIVKQDELDVKEPKQRKK